jgi:hypothetical protein
MVLARRSVVRLGLHVVTACALVPILTVEAKGPDACTDSASESLRNSLHYRNSVADPKQACSHCEFYVQEDNKQCGQCMIMGGPVDPTGHCDSWVVKAHPKERSGDDRGS